MEKELRMTKGDYVHTTIKTLLSMIPVVGTPTAEAFNMIITPPLEKRKEVWINDVVEKLCELEDKYEGISVQSLQNNEQFITCLMNANAIALKTHDEEKRCALRNMLLNAACKPPIDESLQVIYISLINELSPWHIKILDFLSNPHKCFENHNKPKPSYYSGSPITLLTDLYSELQGKNEFYNLIIRDLYNKGLTNTESLSAMMTEQGMWASRTTEIGNSFIDYISSPL